MSTDTTATQREHTRGWWLQHRWLVARRLTQLGVLALFLAGPVAGVWIVQGNLSSSLTLGVLPLSDPFVVLQALAAGHVLETTVLAGAAIVAIFYALIGGRVFCAWVCPMNVVTDTAGWLRARLGIRTATSFPRTLRYWMLAMVCVLAFATGTLAWEALNPVSILHRGLVFGFGLGWAAVLAVFVFDLAVAKRGWCGHVCPMGALYSLLGRYALVRVSAANRADCNDCMDCFAVCPEPQVISPALRGAGKGISAIIKSSECTNCARCLDVCSRDVFRFGWRHTAEHRTHSTCKEVRP